MRPKCSNSVTINLLYTFCNIRQITISCLKEHYKAHERSVGLLAVENTLIHLGNQHHNSVWSIKIWNFNHIPYQPKDMEESPLLTFDNWLFVMI